MFETLPVIYGIAAVCIILYTYNTDGREKFWPAIKLLSNHTGRTIVIASLALTSVTVYSYNRFDVESNSSFGLVALGILSLISIYSALRIVDAN